MTRCFCVYATAHNTEAVRKGYEMGGYVKEFCASCRPPVERGPLDPEEGPRRPAQAAAKPKYPQRMWVNQPSSLQPHHDRHGTNVLAVHEYDDTWRVYLLAGDTISTQMTGLALSPGWRPT